MIKRISSGGAFEERVGYNRAVVAGGWVHVAGTVGVNAETGEVSPDVAQQCKDALAMIEWALKKAGAGFEHVVRVTYMLPDAAEFEPCFDILKATFGDNPPAATMIECALIDPKFRIEIEVTAYIG